MKKRYGLLFAIVFLASLLTIFVHASAEGWFCPKCGKNCLDDYFFCPFDGTARPTIESLSSWPEWNPEGIDVTLKPLGDPEHRHQSFFGPDSTYDGSGAYKPEKVKSARALFREGNYVLVDMDYQTAGKRCVYFKLSSISGPEIEEVELTPHPAHTTDLLVAMCGPGTEYETVIQKTPSKYADWDIQDVITYFPGSMEIHEALKVQRNTVYVEPETDVNVFFETNGWVFAEFNCELGSIRAWLPAKSIAQ